MAFVYGPRISRRRYYNNGCAAATTRRDHAVCGAPAVRCSLRTLALACFAARPSLPANDNTRYVLILPTRIACHRRGCCRICDVAAVAVGGVHSMRTFPARSAAERTRQRTARVRVVSSRRRAHWRRRHGWLFIDH